MKRVWTACALLGLSAGVVYAQTPASQANEPQWKQTPEGRPAVPTDNMNCSGQATRGDDGKVTTSSNCPPAQDQPVPSSASQQFPYPGETQPKPSAQSQPSGAAGQGAAQTPASPAQQFPYPGEQPAAGSNAATKPGGLQDAGSTGDSSSSSASGYSSSAADDAGLPGTSSDAQPDDNSIPTKTRSSRRRPAQPVMTPNQREAEDLQVAAFYQNDGNFRGAYLRAKDAVTVAGDDPEARFALAEAARRLGKLDEAQQNYKKCLSLDPIPKTRKTAEVALKEMTGGGS